MDDKSFNDTNMKEKKKHWAHMIGQRYIFFDQKSIQQCEKKHRADMFGERYIFFDQTTYMYSRGYESRIT